MPLYPDKRVQRSVVHIKKSFMEILEQKNFSEITISEIVQRANYNRGTFYAHFESKDDLLEKIIQETLMEMVKVIRHPYASEKFVNMEELNPDSLAIFQYFKENHYLYHILLSNHIQVDFRYRMANAIEQLFKEEYQYDENEIKGVDIHLFYTYRAHGIVGIIIHWIEDNYPQTIEYMSRQIIQLMMVSTHQFWVKD